MNYCKDFSCIQWAVDTGENWPMCQWQIGKPVQKIMMWLPEQIFELINVFKKQAEFYINFSLEQDRLKVENLKFYRPSRKIFIWWPNPLYRLLPPFPVSIKWLYFLHREKKAEGRWNQIRLPQKPGKYSNIFPAPPPPPAVGICFHIYCSTYQ